MNKMLKRIKRKLQKIFLPYHHYRIKLSWKNSDKDHKKWCKWAFHHVMYPLTIDEKYLRKYIDWNEEWYKKYGVDLKKINAEK